MILFIFLRDFIVVAVRNFEAFRKLQKMNEFESSSSIDDDNGTRLRTATKLIPKFVFGFHKNYWKSVTMSGPKVLHVAGMNTFK